MDFFEDIFDFGDRRRHNRGGNHYDGHNNHDDDDHDEHHAHGERSYSHQAPQYNTFAPVLSGTVCPSCSAPIVQGAKFCHKCGADMGASFNCPSCTTKLPPDSAFCLQCGYKMKP